MTAWYLELAKELNEYCLDEAQARQQELTKPPGSLGMLEQVAIRMASLQGEERPWADNVFITIFAADHGVVAEGVSAFPQAVTAEMVRNFANGGAAITVLARQLDARFSVVNLGTVEPLEPLASVEDARIAAGTANFSQQPAMTAQQLQQALLAGKQVAEQAAACTTDLFIGGEMGIGNTTSATALAAWLLDKPATDLAGPGTGVDASGVNRKAEIVDQALKLHQAEIQDTVSLLQHVGGLEIAGLVGAYLRAAQLGVPILVDGFISTAAALCALTINPSIKPWLLISHQSAEPGHRLLIEKMEERPLLSLDMRLGEGSGAAVAVSLVRSACALHNEMASFADAGISK